MDFEDFVRAKRSNLIWFLLSHGANRHEAEDATQVAFIEVWRKWDTITENPWGWVCTVALRRFWRSSPKAAAGPAREDPAGQVPERTEFPSAADKVELSEQERAVCAMLADLPIKQRQVMALRYDGFSNREIADRLGIDPSAVRHTVLRAKSRLRHLGALTQEDAG
ncbi:RNA polymerase sigma factor [Actinoallomurus acaciae]|uniref:RNA polymerase sigma factor n=1 Tax=Actinoallomurus acaciae TaxID=502577 RepID=A0ABV5Y7L0_9ACTN